MYVSNSTCIELIAVPVVIGLTLISSAPLSQVGVGLLGDVLLPLLCSNITTCHPTL